MAIWRLTGLPRFQRPSYLVFSVSTKSGIPTILSQENSWQVCCIMASWIGGDPVKAGAAKNAAAQAAGADAAGSCRSPVRFRSILHGAEAPRALLGHSSGVGALRRCGEPVGARRARVHRRQRRALHGAALVFRCEFQFRCHPFAGGAARSKRPLDRAAGGHRGPRQRGLAVGRGDQAWQLESLGGPGRLSAPQHLALPRRSARRRQAALAQRDPGVGGCFASSLWMADPDPRALGRCHGAHAAFSRQTAVGGGVAEAAKTGLGRRLAAQRSGSCGGLGHGAEFGSEG
eukprot:s12_g43.t1